ncbi:MAG TPA: 16S rRNA (adenine(1518)-N(6)/adenine(1519)-N(6))-dimethyltransferase RsmA [Sphingomicrobium sp.]|nr:16S rRNA (adenine(1518)-N(6)/adenine(1519)-N(6))-dimethyltransferase RsmA [Sphingomicrobium sp.]
MTPEPAEPLRDVIARHGLQASKSLGQNFILDRRLLARIAAVPGSLEGETVYEVGPGPGGLTHALLETGASVVAVERDRRCMPALAELEARFPKRLRILDADAMAVDEPAAVGGRAHIVSNLPYNVGTALLVRWLTGPWPPWWRSATLMFQREVAERIVATPNSKDYGRLSILAQWRSQPRIVMNVHRSVFVPPPKVMSAVVHLVPSEHPPQVEPRALERLTEAAFGQRRKMLRSSLRDVAGASDALEKLGIDSSRRAETVSVAEWIEIARELSSPG